jgi:two-component system cell cycle response regulator DivK
MTNQLILLIDDDPSVRTLIVRLGQIEGIRVHAAPSAFEALEWLAHTKERPMAILTDFRMPGADGLTFVRVLRERSTYKKTPIFVISTIDDPHLKAEANDLGCVGYITKPIDSKTFGHVLLDSIRLWHKWRQ